MPIKDDAGIVMVGKIDNHEKRIARLETLEQTPGGGGFTLIEEIIVTDNVTNSITFAAIPQDYQHLCILMSARHYTTPGSGCGDTIALQMNGATGAVYDWARRQGAVFSSANSANHIRICFLTTHYTGVPDNARAFNTFVGWISDYHHANKQTAITWHSGAWCSTSDEVPGGWIDDKGSGQWKNLAAITSLRFFTTYAGASFKIDSKFCLYGIPGA